MKKKISINRKDHELPYVCEQLGWKYHHTGIPVKEKIEGERYIPHLKLYVKGFKKSPFGIEWMRFEDDCPLHEMIKTKPHLAFVVEKLDDVLSTFDFNILSPPNAPSDGVRVAMIEYQGDLIELMEFTS